MARQHVVRAFVEFLDRFLSIMAVDESRWYPVAPTFFRVRFKVAQIENRVAANHDIANARGDTHGHVPNGMARCGEHRYARQDFAFIIDRFEHSIRICWPDFQGNALMRALVEGQGVVGHFDLCLWSNEAGIAKLVHVLHMIPMQVRKDDRIDLIGVDAEYLFKVFVHLQTTSPFALVVVFRCALFIAKTRVDKGLVLTGIDVVAENRLPNLLADRPFPKNICAKIGLKPADVDRMNPGFRNAHAKLPENRVRIACKLTLLYSVASEILFLRRIRLKNGQIAVCHVIPNPV